MRVHVGACVGPVDVRAQRAGGCIGDRILKGGRRRARHEIDQALVIPVAGQGQVFHQVRLEFGVRVSFVGLQLRHLRRHGDLLGHRADLHDEIEAAHGIDRDSQPGS